ncbi:MAG: FaeA/PapI family transcriptional regulator [Pseudomonadota bacterium]|jgi:predicted ArsR family transcriptional regulator
MHTASILEYLKRHGQLLDHEIAAATGISLKNVRASLADLSVRGEISRCNVTRYNAGQPVESIQCRISGYVPPAAPGRKPGQ